ncbi:uncharacterized protein si:ch211-250c4.3 [Erpetoichthys calabaricus]|uniref:uncharacterized protein si:ch211-250c4.3 n=1 Tax=Erpetoichthys calabaricus TaxID=27687 RepID=UPI00109EF12A|nr:uncharacterized protein si:ch211-250c4.3 [Erpetoichthys calabaricus]
MSRKLKRASIMSSWQKTIALLVPWRKGKVEKLPDSDVVLTKMKLLTGNLHLKSRSADKSTPAGPETESESEQQLQQQQPKPDCCHLRSNESLCRLPGLFKFESEDSGVELPSGANSPSTPTGSEQSFIIHTRDSSCDSGALTTSATFVPVTDEEFSLSKSPEIVESEQLKSTDLEDGQCKAGTDVSPQEAGEDTDLDRNHAGKTEKQVLLPAFDDMTEVDFQEQPLQKFPTSDSLDEYMDECCRLSEVNQGKVKEVNAGLGYLEHICRLIEKIAQLQEHNLRLQKQNCSLQKEGNMKTAKEEYFMQHCKCGAAGLAYTESKWQLAQRSESTPSDLSTIPEVTRRRKGTNEYGEQGSGLLPPLLRKSLNRRSCVEGTGRFLGDSMEGLASSFQPQMLRRIENHPWGKVKDLVKKTRLRNQSRLGLSSSALKSSCPQLYRPDLGSYDLPKRDRNSMIALGHNVRQEYLWPH